MPKHIKESLWHKDRIICPKCGSEEPATIWDSVNVQTDPDLKTRLLQKKLQNHICANCNLNIIMAEPLLYHDPEALRLYAVLPASDDAALDAVTEQLCGLTPGETEGYTLRRLENYNELIEKIHLDDNDRLDTLMEVVKVAARKGHVDGTPQGGINDLYYLAEKDGVMAFLAQDREDNWGQLDLPVAAYENAEQMLGDVVRAESMPDKWNRVDTAYAVDLINRLSE